MMIKEKDTIVCYGKRMIDRNLTTGSGGNISIYNREQNLIAISPSGLDYYDTKPEDIVIVDLDKNTIEGNLRPSSELDMHIALYKNRDDINAIVHTHSKFATAISCMGWELPAVHYLIGVAGAKIGCADYALYGSKELAENTLKAVGENNAALLGNHGLIALGDNVESAFSTAEHLEFVSEIYYLTKSLGEPNILTNEDMADVMKKFGTYKYK